MVVISQKSIQAIIAISNISNVCQKRRIGCGVDVGQPDANGRGDRFKDGHFRHPRPHFRPFPPFAQPPPSLISPFLRAPLPRPLAIIPSPSASCSSHTLLSRPSARRSWVFFRLRSPLVSCCQVYSRRSPPCAALPPFTDTLCRLLIDGPPNPPNDDTA